MATFASLGVVPELCQACDAAGYTSPTEIQQQALPVALQGKDVIGLAQTGSGKTAAFALPMLQTLLVNRGAVKGLPYGCVLTPTRDLAYQIGKYIRMLGKGIGVQCCVITGKIPMADQAIQLAQHPHIIVATPGRLSDHIGNTRGFSLSTVKVLVLDEADRMLDKDFGPHLDCILRAVPLQRQTMLFSATQTSK
eukprot:gene5477-5473_t